MQTFKICFFFIIFTINLRSDAVAQDQYLASDRHAGEVRHIQNEINKHHQVIGSHPSECAELFKSRACEKLIEAYRKIDPHLTDIDFFNAILMHETDVNAWSTQYLYFKTQSGLVLSTRKQMRFAQPELETYFRLLLNEEN